MTPGGIERRRERRAGVEAPLLIRRVGDQSWKEKITKDVSLAGVYFEEALADPAYAVDDTFMTSVSIPASQRRNFPFTRLAGSGRVVRIRKLQELGIEGQKRVGVALAFGGALTVLTASPPR